MRALTLIALVLLFIGGVFNVFPVAGIVMVGIQKIVGILSVFSAVYLVARLGKR